jgi:uncharacterized damage-inducible protein DinB
MVGDRRRTPDDALSAEVSRALGDLMNLITFDEWASMRIVTALSALDDAQRREPDGSSFGSVHGTFGHLVGAQWIWLERWRGSNPTAAPDWVLLDDFDELAARLRTIEQQRRGFFEGIGARALQTDVAYRTLAGREQTDPLGELLRHAVNHATYHRGQLALRLRQFRVSPPATDYILWRREGRPL